MIKLKFHPDNGTAFYKELKQRLDEYFTNTQTSREGNGIMRFKIFLYFGLDILFYVLMYKKIMAVEIIFDYLTILEAYLLLEIFLMP